MEMKLAPLFSVSFLEIFGCVVGHVFSEAVVLVMVGDQGSGWGLPGVVWVIPLLDYIP